MPTLTMPNLDELISSLNQDKVKPERHWTVILYNDNIHKFDDVVLWVQKATGCSLEDAVYVTNTAHTNGRAVCFQGEKDKCAQVAGYLRRHGLQVEVDQAPG